VKLHALKAGLPGKAVSVYIVAIALTRVGAMATIRPIKSIILFVSRKYYMLLYNEKTFLGENNK
jgi:hypothetical protein